jgi:hypothetical protein
MIGPAEVVSIITRCGIPRPNRKAESKADMAVVVRADSACACVCDCLRGGPVEGDCEEDKIGVRALSDRWRESWLVVCGSAAMIDWERWWGGGCDRQAIRCCALYSTVDCKVEKLENCC